MQLHTSICAGLYPGTAQLTGKGERVHHPSPTVHPLAALKALCQSSGSFKTISWQPLAWRGHMTLLLSVWILFGVPSGLTSEQQQEPSRSVKPC